MSFARCAILLLLFAFPVGGHAVSYLRLDSGIVERRLKVVPADAVSRMRLLRQQFQSAGCDPARSAEQSVEGEALPNMICTLPGLAKGTIVIAAALDFDVAADESHSRWATVAMLPLLAESLNSSSHRCTFVLVAFTGHEKQVGSEAYLNALPESTRRSIVAMIDLDRLGREPIYAFPGPQVMRDVRVGRTATIAVATPHDETPLSQLLLAAANTLKFPLPPQSADAPPVTDAISFDREKIPALVVTSRWYATLNKFDGTQVRVQEEKTDPKQYYQTYNLLCVFGLHLDQAFGSERVKPGEKVVAEKEIADHLLAVINGLRANSKLAPLTLEPRVAGDALQQAAAFAANKRLSNELTVEQRLATLSVPVTGASEVWFVFPEEASKNDALIRESIGEDTRKSLLDPRYTMTGVAAVHRGKSYFAVATLVSPASELSGSDAEEAMVKAIQQSRVKLGFSEFPSATPSSGLRELACSMAKQNSLQVGIDGINATKVYAFESNDPANSSWVLEIAKYGTEPGANQQMNSYEVTLGICRSTSGPISTGNFYVLVELNRK
jgi:uncharacterized protein YkwD